MDKDDIMPNESSMTFGEMREALDDETHPRHEEAVKASAKMAKTFAPAIAAQQKAMQNISFPVMDGLQELLTRNIVPSMDAYRKAIGNISFPVMDGLQELLTRNIAPSMDALTFLPQSSVKGLLGSGTGAFFGESSSREGITSKRLVLPGPAIDTRALAQAAQERAEREKQQHDLFEKQLAVLEAICDNQSILAKEVGAFRQQQILSNKEASGHGKTMMLVGVFTLIVTMVAVGVAIFFGFR